MTAPSPAGPTGGMLDYATVDEALADMADMLEGAGRHTDHTRRQAGRCAYCSCGMRAQGKAENLAAPARPVFRYAVVLADGFEAWAGNSRTRAGEIAANHDGARVEDRHEIPTRQEGQ